VHCPCIGNTFDEICVTYWSHVVQWQSRAQARALNISNKAASSVAVYAMEFTRVPHLLYMGDLTCIHNAISELAHDRRIVWHIFIQKSNSNRQYKRSYFIAIGWFDEFVNYHREAAGMEVLGPQSSPEQLRTYSSIWISDGHEWQQLRELKEGVPAKQRKDGNQYLVLQSESAFLTGHCCMMIRT
jgi:hypothetical protein